MEIINEKEFEAVGMSQSIDWSKVVDIVDRAVRDSKSHVVYLKIDVPKICDELGFNYTAAKSVSLGNFLAKRYGLKRGESLKTAKGKIYIRIEKKKNGKGN